ncbi:MAG: dienelactone hydrolase family protein [Blastocatellia bacterium]
MGTDGKLIQFSAGAGTASGYLAIPKGGSNHPAVIVVQEWWGLNDHIKDIAGRFAEQGYVALAPDLYDGVATKDAGEAGKLMEGLSQEKGLETLDGAVEFLRNHNGVNPERIVITGFCMGGSYALRMACHNPHIKASAPFYGDVPPDDILEKLSAPVLFFGGEQDQWINAEKTNKLEAGLARFKKKGEVKVYSGVGHAFFNDTRPEAYNKAAAEDAWTRTLAFFAENLKG